MEPMPHTMKIARRMVAALEALNKVMLGPQSWAIIKRHLAEIDDYYQKALERAEQPPPAGKFHYLTVSPDTKQRLMDEHGLTEADFIPVYRDEGYSDDLS